MLPLYNIVGFLVNIDKSSGYRVSGKQTFFGDSESLLLYSWKFAIKNTVKLGDKERFDKEQIGVKELFLVTNCQFTS